MELDDARSNERRARQECNAMRDEMAEASRMYERDITSMKRRMEGLKTKNDQLRHNNARLAHALKASKKRDAAGGGKPAVTSEVTKLVDTLLVKLDKTAVEVKNDKVKLSKSLRAVNASPTG